MAACVGLAFLQQMDSEDNEPAISGHALRLSGFGETLLDIAFDVLKPDHRFLVDPRDLLGARLRRPAGLRNVRVYSVPLCAWKMFRTTIFL